MEPEEDPIPVNESLNNTLKPMVTTLSRRNTLTNQMASFLLKKCQFPSNEDKFERDPEPDFLNLSNDKPTLEHEKTDNPFAELEKPEVVTPEDLEAGKQAYDPDFPPGVKEVISAAG